MRLRASHDQTCMHRTGEMVSSTFARPPELLHSRQSLLSDWVETACPAKRGRGRGLVLTIRRTCESLQNKHSCHDACIACVPAEVKLACKALFNLASQAAKGRRGVCEVGPGPGPTSQALLTIWDPLLPCARPRDTYARAYALACVCVRMYVRVRVASDAASLA